MSKTLLTFASISCGLFAVSAEALSANYVEAILIRADDRRADAIEYGCEFGISLESVTGVTGVTLTRNGTNVADFESDGDWWWHKSSDAALANVTSAVSGDWQVQVQHSGGTDSLNFTLSLGGMSAADFPSLPTITQPLNDAVLPEGALTAQWTHPNAAAADLRFMALDGTDSSTEIQFDATTFSWESGLLAPDIYGLSVQYAAYTPADDISTLISGISSTPGITWSTSPFAPASWPSGTPLMATVGVQQIGFTVVPEPTSIALLGVVGMLLGRRSRR